MAALLTYRSRNSFESRFGRKSAPPSSTILRPSSPSEAAVLIHNDGHKKSAVFNGHGTSTTQSSGEDLTISAPTPIIFSAQSYLRYQGDKFVGRFDANCYIAITRKMDVHDVARGRGEFEAVLKGFVQPALVIGRYEVEVDDQIFFR